MMKKLILAAVLCVGSLALTESTTEAGDCYRGPRVGYSGYYSARPYYAPPTVYGRTYRSPYSVYRAPVTRYVPRTVPYSAYRGGYIGPSVGFGYSSFGPYRRSGISIGIGF